MTDPSTPPAWFAKAITDAQDRDRRTAGIALCDKLLAARMVQIRILGVPVWRFKTRLEHVLALSLKKELET